MKPCSKCGEIKPLEEFEKDRRRPSGRGSRCLVCFNKKYKREYAWRYSENNREKERLRSRLSKKLSGWKKTRNPAHDKARAAVRNAVTAGKMIKPTNCPLCGISAVLHAHHKDYSKPLEVEWMGSICHGKEHRKAKQALTQEPT